MKKDINQRNEEWKRHGYWEDYHLNGKPYSIGYYNNGNRIGYWECYYSNGKLFSKGNYDNDNRIGYWEWYNLNGELESQIFFS